MGLNIILILVAAFLVFKDRQDWFRYLIVILASIFFAGTPAGQKVIPTLNDLANWINSTVGSWIGLS